MSTGPEELSLETIAPEDADLIDLRYEGVDLPLDENADPTQVELACGEHLGVVSLEGGYDDESFVDLHVLGEVFRGESAYATAVRNGFVGTEAQWLETLVGPESPNAAVALAAQLAAEQAADRAEAAETGASISETASADHAAAASTARGQAEAYSDSASAYAQASLDFQTQAETSAGEALAYRNQAAQSSTDADSAAARAETAEGVSVTMRNQAQGFSEASAASSQSAETYMDESRVEAQAARDAHLLAETSRENSLAHSQASYDSAQEALARSTEAGEYASAALTSRLAAEAARDDTDVAAAAVIIDRDIVIARADEAGEYAEAAESHRASALTSAGAASVSAENSAISETNAESSRVAAEAARDIAVASSGDAADALTATISYRDQAEIFSDSAGDSATAAATARVAAESARDTANGAASAAATSASSASSSQTAAASSASAASTSATNAATSAGSASTSATNASTSATTAAGHAATASTQATLAAGSATAAGGSATAANTSAGQASTSATNAGNSATASQASRVAAESAQTSAAGSATTAASQASAAATSASSAATSATNAGISATAAATSATNASTSAGSAGTSATNAANSATTATTQANNASTSASTAATHATNAGNSASAAGTSATTAGTHATNAGNSATAAAASQVSAASSFTNTVLIGGNQFFEDGSTGWTYAGGGAAFTTSAKGGRASVFSSAVSGSLLIGTKKFPFNTARKYKITLAYYTGTGTGSSQIYGGFQAYDASGAPLTHNPGGYAYVAPLGSMQAANAGWVEYTSSVIVPQVAGVTFGFPVGTASIALMALPNYNSAPLDWGIDFIRLDDVTDSEAAATQASAAATSASSAATSASAAGSSATAASGSATTANTQAGLASTYAGQSSTSATNAAASAVTAGTAATTATSAAATSTTQASNASTSAASASSFAAIAASVGHRAVNPNAGFDDYATGGAAPVGWSTYSANTTSTRLTDPAGGYAATVTGVAGATVGLYQLLSPGVAANDTYYVIEAEVVPSSAVMVGAGVVVTYHSDNWATLGGQVLLPFDTDPTSSGEVVGAGVAGRRYHFSKLFKTAASNSTRLQVYAFNQYAGFPGNGATKSIDWYRCVVRPATAQEVAAGIALPALSASVAATQSTVATLATNYAAAHYTVAATTSGGAAVLSLVSSTYGTVAGLMADQIYWGVNTFFDDATDTLRTTVGSNYRVIALGSAFGTTSDLVEWFGPSAVSYASISKTNCLTAQDTSGRFYINGNRQQESYTETDSNVPSSVTSSWSDVLTFTLPTGPTTLDSYHARMGLDIQLTPSRTRSSSGSTTPSGNWTIVEQDSSGTTGTERTVATGTWSATIIGGGGSAENVTHYSINADVGTPWTDISREWPFKFGGGGRFVVRMQQVGSADLITPVVKLQLAVSRFS